jgi:hypothetical protein
LPKLEDFIQHYATRMSLASRDYWRMHRWNAATCMRKARALGNPENFQKDFRFCEDALDALGREYAAAENRMTEHGRQIFNHFLVTVQLHKLNAQKMLLAFELLPGGVDRAAEKKITALTRAIRECREAYIADWLLNNRREGVEVSTRVFDEVAASFEELVACDAYARKGFVPLRLDALYNTLMVDIGGIPIGNATMAGIPFRFAGVDHTFVKMDAACKSLSVALPEKCPVKDIHLIASAPMRAKLEKTPLLRLSLSRDGAVVWQDTLNALEHLCDWWAPAGEHTWAGGGYRFIDRERVLPACVPNLYFGLAITSRFPRLEGITADQLQLEWLGPAEVCVFAATLQTI